MILLHRAGSLVTVNQGRCYKELCIFNSGLSCMRNPLTASEDAYEKAVALTGHQRKKKFISGHPGLYCQCLVSLAEVFKF